MRLRGSTDRMEWHRKKMRLEGNCSHVDKSEFLITHEITVNVISIARKSSVQYSYIF